MGEFDFAADSGNGTQFKLDGREVLISCAARSPLSTESKEGGAARKSSAPPSRRLSIVKFDLALDSRNQRHPCLVEELEICYTLEISTGWKMDRCICLEPIERLEKCG